MMRKLKVIGFFLSVFLFCGYHNVEADTSLQELIDKAEAGEIVELPSGTYTESIIIDKPITVVGTGKVNIIADGDYPAVTIKNKGVKLKNIGVENSSSEFGVWVTGSGHTITDVTVKTAKIGIRLHEASGIEVNKVKVIGLPGAEDVGNGIDLFQSVENVIANNTVQDIRDGIYVEYSDANQIIGNKITRSRYGVHFMYTQDNIVRNNTFIDNHTGSMIMVSYNELYENNTLLENRQNVNSQGLYLYDVHESMFRNNRIIDNRIGIMIDNSFTNTIMQNEVQGNGLGIIFKQSTDNDITKNDFKINATTILTYGDNSNQNNLFNNYWDNQNGLDVNGDHVSDLEVVADPYFMEITDKNLSYQLFFQSPGMMLMEQLFKSNPEKLVQDRSPEMIPNIQHENQRELNLGIMFISILFILSSTIIFYLGRKKLQ